MRAHTRSGHPFGAAHKAPRRGGREALDDLQELRLRLQRIQPPRPLRDARSAAAFIRERRIVVASGRSSLPMLAEVIAGEPIKGSWMAHPAVFKIHRIFLGLRRYDLPQAPLILGKESFLDPELGPGVERLATDPTRVAAVGALLPPTARRLLEAVEAEGEIRMDHWRGSPREARRARLLLTRELLVVSRQSHTEKATTRHLSRRGRPRPSRGALRPGQAASPSSRQWTISCWPRSAPRCWPRSARPADGSSAGPSVSMRLWRRDDWPDGRLTPGDG